MTQLRQNKTLFILIITAFLAVQWSSAHIHLATLHDHDGNHHQHATQGHLHDLGSHHIDAIDVSHTDSHENVVELGNECTSPSWKKLDDQPDVFADSFNYHFSQLRYSYVYLASYESPDSSWLSYSTVRLRAPPTFIS